MDNCKFIVQYGDFGNATNKEGFDEKKQAIQRANQLRSTGQHNQITVYECVRDSNNNIIHFNSIWFHRNNN